MRCGPRCLDPMQGLALADPGRTPRPRRFSNCLERVRLANHSPERPSAGSHWLRPAAAGVGRWQLLAAGVPQTAVPHAGFWCVAPSCSGRGFFCEKFAALLAVHDESGRILRKSSLTTVSKPGIGAKRDGSPRTAQTISMSADRTQPRVGATTMVPRQMQQHGRGEGGCDV
jgi:hypothetical protein